MVWRTNNVDGTHVPIINNDAAAEAASPTSYFVNRTGLYTAMAATKARVGETGASLQVFEIGVTYTDDTGIKYLTLTGNIPSDAQGNDVWDSPPLSTQPFKALAGTNISF